MSLWGYSELATLLIQHPNVRLGVIVDTNILISATYELDSFHDDAIQFLEFLIAEKIPLYCNVNIRAEFLEIHRRIVFSEAILDFEHQVNKSHLPSALASLLTTYRNQYERRLRDKPNDPPKRLSEGDLKEFKLEMSQVKSSRSDLWTELCDDRIGGALAKVWEETEIALGLNTLSLREEDQTKHLNKKPTWDDAVILISKYGLASSDAMILNMFLCSKFEGLLSSDQDLAIALKKMGVAGKNCIVPDTVKAKLANV